MPTKNKRNFPRIDSLNLVAYVVYDKEENMIRQGMGRTLNVSKSGILIETHLPIGTDLVVALMLGLEENLVDIRGAAVYSREGDNRMFETGIHFMDVNEAQQVVLDAFITAFEAQKG